MAVNVFKDTTFYKVLAAGWDDTKSPNDKKADGSRYWDGKEIVLVADTPAWYIWCADTENNGDNAGWYLQE